MKVGIVDYGLGNVYSVICALEVIGADVIVCRTPESFKEVDRVILPGVGGFEDCMDTIKTKGFQEALNEEVIDLGKPIYGICLGMQIMARGSSEFGNHKGLGWIEGDVIPLKPDSRNLRVPQMGWNNVNYKLNSPLFADLPDSPDFYFAHSYHLQCDISDEIEATCDYGQIVTVSIKKNNIFATQFHPEKSQDYGLKMLKNFLSWNP